MTQESRRPLKPERHLLTLEMQLCREERPYVSAIPPLRPSHRFLISSPARKPSFYNLTRTVHWPQPPLEQKRKPPVLRSLLYQQYLADIMHRVQRTTYSYKVKWPALLQPREFYTCCPLRYNRS